MTTIRVSAVLLLTLVAALALSMAAPVSASHHLPPPPPPPPPSSSTFIKTYANFVYKTSQQKDLSPEDVQTTSDGGYILLASTDCTSQPCVTAQGGTNVLENWLVKTDASGNPQWVEEVGCPSQGSYSLGVSVHPTADGGYVLGGGTIGCGSGTACPALSGIECAFVEKVDSMGHLAWAHVYDAGSAGSGITAIVSTADGGFLAVGSATLAAGQPSGGLVMKLASDGSQAWQEVLGPSGSSPLTLTAVQPTSDGGSIVVGNLDNPSRALLVRLDSLGNVVWQETFNQPNTESVIPTSDGGFLVASFWGNATDRGALLLKLGSDGSVQWQKAYTGGVYCFFNGYSETCAEIGPFVYSVHPTADGGYILAGDSNLVLADEVPIVPWIMKVDSSGNLLWQHLYYQVYPPTGRPLSEYFASATLAPDGGFLALGYTEDYANGLGLLYVVRTDSTGLCGGTCGEVNPATAVTTVNPGITVAPSSVTVTLGTNPAIGSPASTRTSSIAVSQDC